VLALAWQPVPKAANPKATAVARTHGPSEPAFLVVPGESPLAPGLVHLKVTDSEGHPLDATWSFGTVARGPVAAGVAAAKVPPGPWSILVYASGYGVQALSIDVDTGMTSHLEAVLRPAQVRLDGDHLVLLDKFRWTNLTEVADESGTLLDEVAATLRLHPEITGLRIEGHTDDDGASDENLSLSGARAAAVKAGLIDRGIDEERLSVAGYGGARPLDKSGAPDAWMRNERIELVITDRAR
jgi:hypothetical protein